MGADSGVRRRQGVTPTHPPTYLPLRAWSERTFHRKRPARYAPFLPDYPTILVGTHTKRTRALNLRCTLLLQNPSMCGVCKQFFSPEQSELVETVTELCLLVEAAPPLAVLGEFSEQNHPRARSACLPQLLDGTVLHQGSSVSWYGKREETLGAYRKEARLSPLARLD